MPYFLIALTIALRLIPHPLNLAPVGALGLFAGAYCSPRFAWTIPLLALAIGDSLAGGYNWIVFVFVYLGFLGGPLVGRLMLARKRNVRRFITGTFAAAAIFFVVSNIGSWLAHYPATFAGLVECYVNAVRSSVTRCSATISTAPYFSVPPNSSCAICDPVNGSRMADDENRLAAAERDRDRLCARAGGETCRGIARMRLSGGGRQGAVGDAFDDSQAPVQRRYRHAGPGTARDPRGAVRTRPGTSADFAARSPGYAGPV